LDQYVSWILLSKNNFIALSNRRKMGLFIIMRNYFVIVNIVIDIFLILRRMHKIPIQIILSRRRWTVNPEFGRRWWCIVVEFVIQLDKEI
jgi:hypothetical protein